MSGSSERGGSPAMTRPSSHPKSAKRAIPAPTARRPSSTVPAMRSRTPRVNAQSRRSRYIGGSHHHTPGRSRGGAPGAEARENAPVRSSAQPERLPELQAHVIVVPEVRVHAIEPPAAREPQPQRQHKPGYQPGVVPQRLERQAQPLRTDNGIRDVQRDLPPRAGPLQRAHHEASEHKEHGEEDAPDEEPVRPASHAQR